MNVSPSPQPSGIHTPCHARQGPPVPCIQCIASRQSTFSIHAPCPWLEWYGFHDGLEPAEGFPEVAGVASATKIFGTNPKNPFLTRFAAATEGQGFKPRPSFVLENLVRRNPDLASLLPYCE